MPENRRCPECGKRPTDRLLVQCPDCKIPFVHESAPSTAFTPEQLRAVARHILKSWKFWTGLAVLVVSASWAGIEIVQRMLDARAGDYLRQLDQKTTSQMALAQQQLSNQIALELKQPRIKAAIEQIANETANDLFTNTIGPSLASFQQQMDLAGLQFAKTSNQLAKLSQDVRAAQQIAGPAAPARLVLANHTVTTNASSYTLTLFFKATNDKDVGSVVLVAGTYRQSARILNFAPINAAQPAQPIINQEGDAARLTFTAAGSDPQVAIEISAPTIVRVVGDPLEDEILLPVAMELAQLPTTSK